MHVLKYALTDTQKSLKNKNLNRKVSMVVFTYNARCSKKKFNPAYLCFSHRQLSDCFGVFNIPLYGMFTLSATETDGETETDTDIDKQECIPVGCVPHARLLPVSPSMHCSGVYLVRGGAPGPGGGYLLGGVPAGGGGYLPRYCPPPVGRILDTRF